MNIEIVAGDIARQSDVVAVVNAANPELRPGGGVAGAIHRAAGPGLDRECRAHAPVPPGGAAITGGHGLPNAWVIHCVGPRWGTDEPADDLLASCYREALRLAEEKGIASIAFPAISTGIYGFPLERAADVALRAVTEAAPHAPHVRLVRFVLHDERALDAHRAALDGLHPPPGA